MSDAPPYEPDTKDWTWVLDRPCPECGYDAATVAPTEVAGAIRVNAAAWSLVLERDGATARPAPTVWSPTEYAAHVRDVHGIFTDRVAQMRTEDDPEFANWDQDEAAVAGRYDLQDPAVVAPALVAAAAESAAAYDAVPDGDWERTGRRSNGSRFTVATLATYHLHDVVHHLWDVST